MRLCQLFADICSFLSSLLLYLHIQGDDYMKKMAKLAIVFTLIFILTIEGTPTYAADSVIIDSTSINMRSGPGLTYEVTGSLKKGDQVDVLSTSEDWLYIKSNNKKGWIASWLTVSSKTSTSTSTIVSQVDGLNIRSAPSVGSAVIGRMNAGDEAVMTGREGNWVQITHNNSSGWVHTDYISSIAKQDENKQTTEKKATETFTVAVDTLNVRQKASLASKRTDVIHKGETYSVKEVNDNWVQISLSKGKEGWVYSFHGNLSTATSAQKSNSTSTKVVTILTDGTNIRKEASTSSSIAIRANAGQQFDIQAQTNDWYEISLPTGGTAFVASWVVSADEEAITKKAPSARKKARTPGTLNGLTIVIDPGHGGNDRGTTGVRGTDEKYIALMTSELLASKLKAAGATVKLTRETDTYVALHKRVAISHQHDADAYISVHYDATLDSSISGFTTYYTYNWQKELANEVNNGLDSSLSIRNRGVQPGNFFVLRENRQNAILIELGFLSNASEERIIKTDTFREQAAHGIYNGLLNYFNKN